MMIWQLLQVKHLQATPLILVGAMWPGLVDCSGGNTDDRDDLVFATQ